MFVCSTNVYMHHPKSVVFSSLPAGTPVADHHLADLACLSLRRLSLADTGVGDEGVGQLLAMQHLTSLDIRWAGRAGRE